MNLIRNWYHRHLSDPQVFILVTLLMAGTVLIAFLGKVLAPVLASVVIAYLLEGIIAKLTRWRMPRLLAVLLVFSSFMAFVLFLLLLLAPRLSAQVAQVVGDIPSMITHGQTLLMQLPERYPDFISRDQIISLVDFLQMELGRLGQQLLTFSIASFRGMMTFLVYLILMPLMVFFFLKDKDKILSWITRFMPTNRRLSTQVWQDVDRQLGNYVRGKILEILIVWAGSYLVFFWLDLKYAMLLGLVVGLSVIIPYIGATVATFPVGLVGFYQWGFGQELVTVLIAYGVIQLLDGNLLAMVLLSEVVNLHPVAIIVSIFIFGHFWGFWGVFFAIPLATLVESVIRAWPRNPSPEQDSGA